MPGFCGAFTNPQTDQPSPLVATTRRRQQRVPDGSDVHSRHKATTNYFLDPQFPPVVLPLSQPSRMRRPTRIRRLHHGVKQTLSHRKVLRVSEEAKRIASNDS